MSKKSLLTPQDRRSMLGFGSAAAKLKQQQKRPPEQKRLTFSANRSRLQVSSVGSKRWSSQGSHQLKDTRPLSNRGYQKQMVEEILEFLNDSGYPHQISTKVLSAPTSKEFLRVFEHLYGYINSNFKMDKKYEEEVPRILKSLNYPFTISKSAMFAIGSLHTWPTLLGALHWMVELIRTVSTIDIEQMLFPVTFAEEENTCDQKKMFFEYYTSTYQEFMLGKDDFSEAQEVLQSAIIRQAGCSEEDHEALVSEVAALEEELALLEAEPDVLEEAIKLKTSLEEIIEQDLMCMKELEQESDVLKQQYIQFHAQVHEEGVDFAQLGDPSRQEEIKHKSTEVKLQLERLNSEKERLEQQNCEREMRYSKLYDKFSITVNQYNDIERELSLNVMVSQYLGENSIALQFDHNQKDLSALNDCKLRLKPLLVKLADRVAEDRYLIEEQKLDEMDRLDKIIEESAEKKHELTQLKVQLVNIDKELEAHQEVLAHGYKTSIEKLQEQEDYLEEKLNEINETYQEELDERNIKRLNIEEQTSKQSKEQNEYAQSLIDYCISIKELETSIQNRVKNLNVLLKGEIDAENKIKETMNKLNEE